MIRAIFFLLKVAILALIVVWVAEREGNVRINWIGTDGADMALNMHLGIFLLSILGIFLIALFLFRIAHGFVRFPKSWARYKEYKNREKGLRALTLGLTAVAAGDKKSARYQAHRANKLLPEQTGLGLLLKAQSARLEGREDLANEHFVALMQDKDAAFLGVRGLLQSALDRKDYDSALKIAREALKLHGKQTWILKITYELEIRQRDMDAALKTLYRLEKAKGIEKDKAQSDRIAMLVYEADQAIAAGVSDKAQKLLEKAYSYDASHIPTVTRLARLYIQKGKRTKAVHIIEKTWKNKPHPDLVPLWGAAAPKNKAGSAAALYTWYEKLLSENSESAESQMALAKVAIESALWGEAKLHLKLAENKRTGKMLYQLFATLEEKTGRRSDIIQNYLHLASEADPDRCWICNETGRIYENWSAFAMPHGAFNTMVWDFPPNHERSLYIGGHHDTGTAPMPVLEAPAR